MRLKSDNSKIIRYIYELLKNIFHEESFHFQYVRRGKSKTSYVIEIDEDALVFIAEKSDGSMRESISKLDRVRAYASSDKLTKENVLDILGIVDDDDFSKLTKSINESDIESAISILSDCLERGKDISQFTNDFIWHLRNLLIAKDIKEPIESLNITRSNFEKLNVFFSP